MTILYPNSCYNEVCYKRDCTVILLSLRYMFDSFSDMGIIYSVDIDSQGSLKTDESGLRGCTSLWSLWLMKFQLN